MFTLHLSVAIAGSIIFAINPFTHTASAFTLTPQHVCDQQVGYRYYSSSVSSVSGFRRSRFTNRRSSSSCSGSNGNRMEGRGSAMNMMETIPKEELFGYGSDELLAKRYTPKGRDPRKWFQDLQKGAETAIGDKTLFADLKEASKVALETTPLPHRKWEPYRYYQLEPLYRTAYTSVTPITPQSPMPASMETMRDTCGVEAAAGRQLVFVNGYFSAHLSNLKQKTPGAFIGSVRDLSGDRLAKVKDLLSVLPESAKDLDPNICQGALPFATLNQAAFDDVAVIMVDNEVTVEEPIQVIFLSSGGSQPTITHPRFVVSLGRNATATLVQSTAGEGEYFANTLSSVSLGEGANMTHYYSQEDSKEAQFLETMTVNQDAYSSYHIIGVSMGARQGRLNLQVEMVGTKAHCDLNLLNLCNSNQLLDSHTAIGHTTTDCTSAQQQRNVVTDRSDCVFKGRIRVDQPASGTDSNQLCKTLLLSNKARITAMPSLEIINSDVKCSHGATVSDLNEEALFYLESRGMNRIEARGLLIRSFTTQIMGDTPNPALLNRVAAKVVDMTPRVDRATKGVYSSI